MHSLALYLQVLKELGLRQVAWYAIYQLGLRTGYYRCRSRFTSPQSGLQPIAKSQPPTAFFPLPTPAHLQDVIGECSQEVLAEANEIVQGQVRLFGGKPAPLQLVTPGSLGHWTEYESGRLHLRSEDIKFLWEPARFGWVFTLGRAYLLSGDESYPQAFWRFFAIFQAGNPPNRGLHWVSAQEISLRLMAWAFAWQVFQASPESTPARLSCLQTAIAQHAERIPLTLTYARAQNNNHLLSEAAGLYTAACVLPGHPQARHWRALGWKLFHQGLHAQIAADGVYIQHSTNYQRLMLQLGLWMYAISQSSGQNFPVASLHKLAAATRWLLALVDEPTGQVPNLGPNDGAYIFPLSICPFADYRPVLQAAAQVFLGIKPFRPGPWDELAEWFGKTKDCSSTEQRRRSSLPEVEPQRVTLRSKSPLPGSPHVLRAATSWAYLRAAHFYGRPGHADQLHLDLWWRGLNLAQDAGTYLYNVPAPWNNSLAGTQIHNTLTVDGQAQMQPVGRFLFVGRAQAAVTAHEQALDGSWSRLVARHTGYRKFGLLHERTVTLFAPGRWVIDDKIPFAHPSPTNIQHPTSKFKNLNSHSFRLHWLLPDWPWELQGGRLRVQSPYGWVELGVTVAAGAYFESIRLVRAGELLCGTGEVNPVWGWVSPTYGLKMPALAFILEGQGVLPICLTSAWILPETCHAA